MIQKQLSVTVVLSLCLVVFGCSAKTSNPTATAAAKTARQSDPIVNAYVAAMRDDLSHGKVGIINNVMQLDDQEARIFWPIYQEYEQELFDLGDARVEGIREFVGDEKSGKLNNPTASRLATAYFDYETKRLELVKKYYGIISEKLSPVRAAQFTQIEHRVGTVVDLLIASELPLITPAPEAAPARASSAAQ